VPDLSPADLELDLAAPILLTSGHSEDLALGHVGQNGVVAFLPKPYAPLVLIDALRGIAAR
jgi:FixJ family two-component response regulator